MKNVLLTIDVENFDESLVAFALDLCRRYEAKLWIIHVVPSSDDHYIPYDVGPEYMRVSMAEELRKEHRLLQKLADRVSGEKVDAEALLIGGEIVDGIIDQSVSVKADLVITGVNEHGFLANALGGNTALEIIKRSEVPVLTFPLE
ncbi:MAG: universal stress protein [Cryomorphaceae bacterium]|nr:universal stress protein [Flavobacteriales bacterium]